MANNLITFELCAEDRQRIDNLTDALIANGGAVEALLKQLRLPESTPVANDDIARMAAAVVSPENGSQNAKEPTQAETPKAKENPAPKKDAPPWETLTVADIRAKVIDLSSKGKGDEAKAIVKSYAPSIPALPEAVFGEVMAKLNALEG